MSEPFDRIFPAEAKARLDDGWEPFVLDVRAPHEAQIASLSFTDLLQPHVRVLDVVDQLPKDRDILVYCRSGGRSAMAAGALAKAGFRCLNLEGGINRWAAEIDRTLRSY